VRLCRELLRDVGSLPGCAGVEQVVRGGKARHPIRLEVVRLADGVTKSFPVSAQNVKPGRAHAYQNFLAQIRRWLRESPPE